MTIRLSYLYRKVYCHHCGEQLKKTGAIYTNRIDFDKYNAVIAARKAKPLAKLVPSDGSIDIFKDTINGEHIDSQFHFGYKCPNCNSIISIKSQDKIRKLQKEHGAKILPPELTEGINMAQKRTYTDEELFWALDKDCEEHSYLVKPDHIE